MIWTHVNLSQKLLTRLSLDVTGRLNWSGQRMRYVFHIFDSSEAPSWWCRG